MSVCRLRKLDAWPRGRTSGIREPAVPYRRHAVADELRPTPTGFALPIGS
jgi:hypothetical protein